MHHKHLSSWEFTFLDFHVHTCIHYYCVIKYMYVLSRVYMCMCTCTKLIYIHVYVSHLYKCTLYVYMRTLYTYMCYNIICTYPTYIHVYVLVCSAHSSQAQGRHAGSDGDGVGLRLSTAHTGHCSPQQDRKCCSQWAAEHWRPHHCHQLHQHGGHARQGLRRTAQGEQRLCYVYMYVTLTLKLHIRIYIYMYIQCNKAIIPR